MPKIKRLLLVEDEFLIAMVKQQDLENYGYAVIHANTGEKAVTLCKSGDNFDLILMDIDLGSGIDGTEAAEIILKEKSIPILFMSSHTEQQIVEKTEKITSYGYVVKSANITVLDASIKMAFKLFKANRKLEEEKRYLQITFNSIGDAVIATDINGNISRMNRVAEKLTEWDFSDALGEPLSKIFKIINSKSRNIVENPVQKVFETGNIIGLANHTVLISKTGKEYQISDSAAPIIDDKGRILGVILVFSDVTEQYKIKEVLSESEEKYRAAFMTSPDSININAMDGLYVDINEGFTNLTGYTREDVIGVLSSDIKIWDIPEDREKLIIGLREKGFVDNLKSVFRCKDGSLQTAVMSAKIIQINKVPHILSITRTITESPLSDLNKFLLIVEHSPESIVFTNLDGNIEYVNPKFCQLTGYSMKELVGNNPRILQSGKTPKENFEILWETILSGNTWKGEFYNQKKNGDLYFEKAIIIPLKNGKNEVTNFIGIKEDITEKRKASGTIKQQMMEKEILLKEIHHRVKNNFTSISNMLSLQANSIMVPQAIDALNDAVGRVNSMAIIYDKMLFTDNFLTSSVKQYLNSLIDDIVSLFPEKSNIIVEKQIEELSFSPKQLFPIGIILNELLTNIMKYAFAGKKSGKINIVVKLEHQHIMLQIKDNGIGLPKDFDINNSKGFGIMLIGILTKQLEATFTMENKNGTLATLIFPIS